MYSLSVEKRDENGRLHLRMMGCVTLAELFARLDSTLRSQQFVRITIRPEEGADECKPVNS